MATKIGAIPIEFTGANADLVNIWTPFGTETRTLKKGWIKDEGRRPLPIDILWHKDVPIPMRDGVNLYGDVFIPANTRDPLPAILPWSAYGKTGTGRQNLDRFPYRVGVPRSATSGLEKFEAPDPAEWCGRGYAIVNVDARGAYLSEGNRYVYGSQESILCLLEAEDGYDTIEWIAKQTWCTGNVGMAGNSWLATMQWFIAAMNPPSLKAIAPWEGLGDFYRESICRGGIPDHCFWDQLFENSRGKHLREDVTAMIHKYPLWNEYWEDKKPALGSINLPMYATISYSTGLHTEGSIRGFLLSASKEKWLRFHHTQEWHDIYQPEATDELHRFFDRYLKGRGDRWENVPRIRLSLIGYNRPSIIGRPISSYPPTEFQLTTFYLDATEGLLSRHPVSRQSVVQYKASDRTDPGTLFSYRFEKYTEMCGFSRVKLYMSCRGHDDMDVYVVVCKMERDGKLLKYLNVPLKDLPPGTTAENLPDTNVFKYIGPNGRLRASHRKIMEEPGLTVEQRSLLSEAYVWHPHDKEDKITPGQVVDLDIGLWPGGMVFDPGESMALIIKGSLPILPEHPGMAERMVNYNVGSHAVHTGKMYPSCLKLFIWQENSEPLG